MLKIIKAIRARYILALLAMALLVSMAAGLMQVLLYEKQQDAEIVNVAGMQRMLSQKVLLLTHRLTRVDASSDSLVGVYNQLHATIDLFSQNHEFLIQLQTKQQVFSEKLYDWYFSAPTKLDQRSRQFVERARNIQLKDQNELNELYLISQALLADLDHAVSLFEEHANKGVERLRYVEIAIWFLAMVLLLLEAKFIFRPMEKQVQGGIDELKREKKKTEQALNMKSRFLARASHELRTPLQSILGYLDLYKKERQTYQLDQAITSVKQLNILINEMHDFSRWSNEKIKIQNSYAKLSDTLETVIAPYRLTAQKKGLSLVMQLSHSDDQLLLCDHQHLAWICSQLVDNAIKFNDKGEVSLIVNLQCTDSQPYLEVQVIDQGYGFSKEQLASLELHEETNNHFQGMQLGLARCQWLVGALSGEMRFLNTQQGGACVQFSIPVTIAKSETAEQQRSANGKTALLVEDNKINAVVLCKQLDNLGFKVLHVHHGKEAVDVLAVQSFDVIFMDLNMPYMDGYETIDYIRTQLHLDTIIIVITANDEHKDLAKAIALGADEHLIKPLQQQSLIKILEDIGMLTAT
ncbi:response regulator [Pseudoalteromonas sp. S16_S37]|uniref:response regulator n=1 Tax=Pseudoalteromonas sp. S16_S37 TaxID=2720228 RepID=UPI0016805A97|nr:response regulator [Pseudoalteromonas sp. S16_S37]MBD1582421.1 response regulator [Pseudoalteromonas sp. S16_S37]